MVQKAYFRGMRAHSCEKIAKVVRGIKEGAVLKKLFRKNLNRQYGKKE